MRKVIFLCVLVAFMLAPLALAADKTVSFYGSVRVVTFSESQDAEYIGGTGGLYSDRDTTWTMEPWTSRLGVDFAVGDVTGKVELRPNAGGHVRHWYGTWKVGPGKFVVGQTWTPTFIGLMESNLASDYLAGGTGGGADVAGSLRVAGLQYWMPVGNGNLKIALLNPSVWAGDASLSPGLTSDTDATLPKIEVSYDTKISKVGFGFFGGYNSSTVEYHAATATGTSYSYDLDSWGLGGWFNVDFQPAYIKGSVTFGQNLSEYGWAGLFPQVLTATPYVVSGVSNIADVDYLSYGLVVGFVANDKFTLEGWYYHSESDYSTSVVGTTTDVETEGDVFGVIAIFKAAENVYIMPEIARYDGNETTTTTNGVANVIPVENGTTTIYGICWKINF